MNFKILWFLILLVSNLFSFDIKTEEGRAEYKWLKLPQDAKSLSMSGLDKPNWYNDSTPSFNLERLWLAGYDAARIDKWALSLPALSGVFAIQGLIHSGEKLEGYDLTGQRTADFSAQFFGFGLSYQYKYRILNAGLKFHYLYSEIEANSSQALLYDLETEVKYEAFVFFVKAINLGEGSTYLQREIVPPFGLRSGLSYKINLLDWLTLDPFLGVHYQNDEEVFYPIGAEIGLIDKLIWRFSYALSSENTRIGTGLSLDLGILILNYGFQSHEYLGGYHSLGFEWPF